MANIETLLISCTIFRKSKKYSQHLSFVTTTLHSAPNLGELALSGSLTMTKLDKTSFKTSYELELKVPPSPRENVIDGHRICPIKRRYNQEQCSSKILTPNNKTILTLNLWPPITNNFLNLTRMNKRIAVVASSLLVSGLQYNFYFSY